MRILIADDDAVARLILQKYIEKLGHEVLVAKDGLEAWEQFQRAPVDVVVSDWLMPGMDGLELCRKIRHHDARDRGYAYVVLLTALTEKQHFITGMQAGADDFLTKPLDREELQVRLIAAARVTSLHRQLTEQKRELELLNVKLYEESRRDGLTRLRNRLCMQEDLPGLHDRCRRYGHTFSAALCDIDAYKKFNDHYGHLAGDEALKTVAQTLTATCRTGDTIYRYGGEEFLVLLPEQDAIGAALAMERVRAALQAVSLPHAPSPFGVVTLSVGIASLAPGEDKALDLLLKQADSALYHAKETGRNRVSIFDPAGCRPYEPDRRGEPVL